MARFVVGTPQITREPTITVDAGLPVGRHRFRLEVVDASGLRSAPDQAIVEVQRIIIDPGRIPTGPVIPTPGPVIGPVISTPGPVIGPVISTGPIVGPVIGPVIPTPGPIIRPTRPRTRTKKEKP
jgi:hypothetical protein